MPSPDLDYADSLCSEPASQQDSKDVKSNLSVRATQESTYIILLVIHDDPDRNKLQQISCDRGTPLGGYVYDSVKDCYFVSCLDYLPLGYIPVSFKVEMKNAGHWAVSIPVPEKVLKRYLDDQQKTDLKRLRDLYNDGHHRISFLQMIGTC